MWAERPTHPWRSEFLCLLHRSVSRTRCVYGSACTPSAGTSWWQIWKHNLIKQEKNLDKIAFTFPACLKWFYTVLNMICSPYPCLEVYNILKCEEKQLCCPRTQARKKVQAWLLNQPRNLSNQIRLSTFNPPKSALCCPELSKLNAKQQLNVAICRSDEGSIVWSETHHPLISFCELTLTPHSTKVRTSSMSPIADASLSRSCNSLSNEMEDIFVQS